MKPKRQKLRVLHAPVNIGNQPWSLSRAERQLGLTSDLMINYQTSFGYPADVITGSLGAAHRMAKVKRAAYGWTAPMRYDVLHYYFGRSLLLWDDLGPDAGWPFADLRLAKKLGRQVIMTLQGCDVRIAAESNAANQFTPCAAGRCSAFETCVASLDAQRRNLITDILPLCDRVFYLNPELGHFLPDSATFMPYANVDIDAFSPEPREANEVPIVIHAPSDPAIKGTSLILDALETLKQEFEFELVLVQGMTHEEAMATYRRADLVIDQVLAGWYGGLAVEVMAMGIPVACALRAQDLHVLDPKMRAELPIFDLDPENLVTSLRGVFAQHAQWKQIGQTSRTYVERWHHPRRIAKAMSRIYRDPTAPLEI